MESITSINWIDISALLLVAYLAIRGWLQGLIQSLFHYLSIIGGTICAIIFRSDVIHQFRTWELPLSDFWMEATAILLTFVAVFLAIQIVGWSLAKIIRPTPLGPIDKIGGTLFGGLKGISLLFLAVFALETLPLPIHQWTILQEAKVYTWCSKTLPTIEKYWGKADSHIRSSYTNYIPSLPKSSSSENKADSLSDSLPTPEQIQSSGAGDTTENSTNSIQTETTEELP